MDVGDILKCHVCLGSYNDSSHRPLLLPACGHTFCASCLENLQKQSRVNCPECRKPNAIQPVSSLPVNYVVLNLEQAKQEKQGSLQGRAEDVPLPQHRSQPSSRRCSDPPPVDLMSASPLRHLRRSGSTSGRTEYVYQSPERPGNPPHHRAQAEALRLSPSRQLRRTASARSDQYPQQMFGFSAEAYGMSPPRPLRRSASIRSECSEHTQHMPGVPRMLERRHPVTHALAGSTVVNTRGCPQAYRGTVTEENERCARELQEELDFQMAVHLTFCKNVNHGHDDGALCAARRWQYPEDEDLRTALLLSRVNLN
ncbi:uncharacterized protein [Palaemon carinicauda]|uniref:uncharacterized protein n=2 Tax=Palaemon carinicauda TaxID=392227 RepID=UPI0035B58C79